MRNRPTGAAPDLTTPALISAGVNIFLWLAVIWANLGFAMALLVAAIINAVIALKSHRLSS